MYGYFIFFISEFFLNFYLKFFQKICDGFEKTNEFYNMNNEMSYIQSQTSLQNLDFLHVDENKL
jgi:Leucine-rich repeat (LRR) protein